LARLCKISLKNKTKFYFALSLSGKEESLGKGVNQNSSLALPGRKGERSLRSKSQ